MDDFSLEVWSEEFSIVPLDSDQFKAQLADGNAPKIDLLFVESSWNGNGGKWQYQLAGQNAPSEKLRELVEECNRLGIPTAFWNKEDPPHFHDFLGTAKLFDVVFTTAEEKIPEYIKELGHDKVYCLPFAAQPKLHNPIRLSGDEKPGDIAFAGMYFKHKFQERREQMDLLLGAAAAVAPRMRAGLAIYSRYSGGDERYQFPAPFDRYVVGGLPYKKMVSAYRQHKVFLNVNSVVNSTSMCSRRVFEILASGTVVVSTPSAAIHHFFDTDELPTVSDGVEAQHLLRALVNSKELRDRIVHKAQRKIWTQHTYEKRAEFVLEMTLGLTNGPSVKPRISVISATNRPEQIHHLFEQVGRQCDVEVELCLALHGFDEQTVDLPQLQAQSNVQNLKVVAVSSDESLGNCLNRLVELSTGDYIAKMDDDDEYGRHYLIDQYYSLKYSGADLVGKQAVYVSLEQSSIIALKNSVKEHRWTDFVAGPTLFGPRSTFEEHPFEDRTIGEDSAFLSSLVKAGKRIYSADRFNFLQVRGKTNHTWGSKDLEFLANSEVVLFNTFRDHFDF
ncbi:glycosyltransferase [Corynebacterium sp. c8Ua_181]|uniref:Glycosyltransferase n=1 Tax=Corynebacterium curieae TaxID=2913500 RepID=A0A9X3M900_9CORY|nr:glycosyltransferase [Corynebacterium curieae]MCZ9306432.1 glycosyltransferase [Corynebacterium curieae]MDV2423999.1 glycosyltransferase [Corynebacterium curieae]